MVCGMFLLDMFLEFVATMFTVGAIGTLVLRLATTLECHMPHQIAPCIITTMTVRTAIALLGFRVPGGGALASLQFPLRFYFRRFARLFLVFLRLFRLGVRRSGIL